MLRINYCFVVIAVAALLPLSMRPDTFPIDLRDAVDARSVMSHLVVFLRVAILSPIGTLTHTLERSRQHSMTLVVSLIACSHLNLIQHRWPLFSVMLLKLFADVSNGWCYLSQHIFELLLPCGWTGVLVTFLALAQAVIDWGCFAWVTLIKRVHQDRVLSVIGRMKRHCFAEKLDIVRIGFALSKFSLPIGPG